MLPKLRLCQVIVDGDPKRFGGKGRAVMMVFGQIAQDIQNRVSPNFRRLVDCLSPGEQCSHIPAEYTGAAPIGAKAGLFDSLVPLFKIDFNSFAARACNPC